MLFPEGTGKEFRRHPRPRLFSSYEIYRLAFSDRGRKEKRAWGKARDGVEANSIGRCTRHVSMVAKYVLEQLAVSSSEGRGEGRQRGLLRRKKKGRTGAGGGSFICFGGRRERAGLALHLRIAAS